jgi:hypothetical protein
VNIALAEYIRKIEEERGVPSKEFERRYFEMIRRADALGPQYDPRDIGREMDKTIQTLELLNCLEGSKATKLKFSGIPHTVCIIAKQALVHVVLLESLDGCPVKGHELPPGVASTDTDDGGSASSDEMTRAEVHCRIALLAFPGDLPELHSPSVRLRAVRSPSRGSVYFAPSY